jgi:hypothetical protein
VNFEYSTNAGQAEPSAYEVSAGAAPLCDLMRRYSDATDTSDRATSAGERRNGRNGLAG